MFCPASFVSKVFSTTGFGFIKQVAFKRALGLAVSDGDQGYWCIKTCVKFSKQVLEGGHIMSSSVFLVEGSGVQGLRFCEDVSSMQTYQ